ncbi:MAG: hypothetical protein JSW73_04155 [Candidatus Woesearchaeota archaeon]|nr:MAG: hypothetical protein JSW73_04155 [Candidatus Woesearchaeota archaeon]
MSSIVPYIQLSNKLCFEEIKSNREDIFLVITLTNKNITKNKIKCSSPYRQHTKASISLDEISYKDLKFDKDKNPLPDKIDSIFNTYVLNKDDLNYYEIDIKLKEEISQPYLESVLNDEEEVLSSITYSLANVLTSIVKRKKPTLITQHHLVKFGDSNELFFTGKELFFRGDEIPIDKRVIEVIKGYLE